eukprot:2486231-Amphidinium_carterae.1
MLNRVEPKVEVERSRSRGRMPAKVGANSYPSRRPPPPARKANHPSALPQSKGPPNQQQRERNRLKRKQKPWSHQWTTKRQALQPGDSYPFAKEYQPGPRASQAGKGASAGKAQIQPAQPKATPPQSSKEAKGGKQPQGEQPDPVPKAQARQREAEKAGPKGSKQTVVLAYHGSFAPAHGGHLTMAIAAKELPNQAGYDVEIAIRFTTSAYLER